MKAVRIHEYGSPAVLRYEDAPRPAPQAGEVLVRVHAAGVNPMDAKVRTGLLAPLIDRPFPLTLGWDVAGTVAVADPSAREFATGDAVYGVVPLLAEGAYAEYVTLKAANLAPKPESLDYVAAAAVPLVGLTAWQGLFDTAGLSPGQTVLIHGAAGGVGHIAVQLAKWRGARVIGTASARNESFIRELGADEVIDYTARPFQSAVHGIDVVFDLVGGETQARSFGVLKRGGILISTVQHPPAEEAKRYGVRGAYLVVQPSGAELRELSTLIEAGRVRPVVEAVLPLAGARQAHELLETRHRRGKAVLRVA